MSWFKLLEVNPKQGKVTKISPDGKQISVQTGPGQTMNLDLDKDPNIDVSSSGGKTSIKLNHDNKTKLKIYVIVRLKCFIAKIIRIQKSFEYL